MTRTSTSDSPRSGASAAAGGGVARGWTLVGAGSLLVAVALAVRAASRLGHPGYMILDEQVYVAGGKALLHGQSIYGFSVTKLQMKFTYPPFAALVLIPLVLVPMTVAMYGWFAIGIAALGVSCWIVAGALPELAASPWWPRRWVTAAVLFGTGTIMEPVEKNSSLGQISAVLMMLVVVDLLVAWRFRGMLIGLAAAIKVVPAIFILLLLVTRQRRAGLWAIGTAAAAAIAGALAAPRDSWLYWTQLLYDTTRVGSVLVLQNGSLLGTFSRLIGRNSAVTMALWLGCALVIAAAGLAASRAVWRFSPVTAMVIAALATLLILPISWDHYYVWLVPAAGVLAALGVRAATLRLPALSAASAAAALAIAIVGVVGPVRFGHMHPGLRLAASCAYVSVGLLSLAVLLAAARARTLLWPTAMNDQPARHDEDPASRDCAAATTASHRGDPAH